MTTAPTKTDTFSANGIISSLVFVTQNPNNTISNGNSAAKTFGIAPDTTAPGRRGLILAGFVGIEDLNAVLGNWNAGSLPPQDAAVPEPGVLVILAVGAWALARGVKEIELNVWEVNPDAIAFYERMGYQSIRRTMRLVMASAD